MEYHYISAGFYSIVLVSIGPSAKLEMGLDLWTRPQKMLAVDVIITFEGIFCFLHTVPACQPLGQLLGSLLFAEHPFPLSPAVSMCVCFRVIKDKSKQHFLFYVEKTEPLWDCHKSKYLVAKQQLGRNAYTQRQIFNSKQKIGGSVTSTNHKEILICIELISRSLYWIDLNRSFVQIGNTENVEVNVLRQV